MGNSVILWDTCWIAMWWLWDMIMRYTQCDNYMPHIMGLNIKRIYKWTMQNDYFLNRHAFEDNNTATLLQFCLYICDGTSTPLSPAKNVWPSFWALPLVFGDVADAQNFIPGDVFWLVVWTIFSIYWEFHHPNWRTPSFFRGVAKNYQPEVF